MLTINSIRNGVVIDHIRAGFGMKIFKYLELDQADYSVALIMNVESEKYGRKDIIKIENEINIDFTVLGLIDPNITVNVIQNEKTVEKISLQLPEKVEGVIKCKNPRCVTSVERHVPHVFYLTDENKREYRCKYCDESYPVEDMEI